MSLKPVVILSDSLPVGLKANIAVILGMNLGQHHPELVGADTLCVYAPRDYADYTLRIHSTSFKEQLPQGVLLAGPKKQVDLICGQLPLLR